MGVDFSHGDVHFGHRSFLSYRKTLAAMVGVRLGEMQGLGGTTDWAAVADPIAPLLSRNDAGGELTRRRPEARPLASSTSWPTSGTGVAGDQCEDLLAGLKEAAEAGEPFVIMG